MSEETKVIKKKKAFSNVYFLFSSLLMLVPPLSLGLTVIYFENQEDNFDIIGLIMNYSIILIMAVVAVMLIINSKISKPNREDFKFLLFGLLSNAVIYLFVFQFYLEIDQYIDLYITTISILFLYFIFVDHKKFNWELWIISIVFFAFYRFHMEYVYDDFSSFNKEVTVPIRILYSSIPIIAVTVNSIKIYKYKVIDWFSGTFIGLSIVTLLYLIETIEMDNKLFLTIFLLMPFIIIIDFIVSIINKRFNIYKIPFYIRMVTFVFLINIFRAMGYFTMATYQHEELFEYTFLMSSLIVVNIIEYFIKNKKKIDIS